MGQTEIEFQLEDHATSDTARADLRCFVKGIEGHPGEAKARNVLSNRLVDVAGIHNNKDAFGKVCQMIQGRMLHVLLRHIGFAAA